ncbi:MAG: DUF3619 family protein [Pseudomonadota bacterium]
MNNSHTITVDQLQDEFGERVAARLSAGAQALPQDVSERLRSMRLQAVARRKVANVRARTAAALFGYGSATVSVGSGAGGGNSGPGFWGRLASALPLAALVGGLVAIHVVQSDNRVSELAEVDAALLTDDLPPAAFTDPGFAQFLKDGAEKPN